MAKFKSTSATAWSLRAIIGIFSLAAWTGATYAQSISVPNGSFESPSTVFVDNNIGSWQKPAQPAWYNPVDFGGVTWHQTSGVFANTTNGSPDHINNLDGNQAVYLFAFPEVGLFQEIGATFQAGVSYQLTVGILGAGGIAEGSSFAMSLYYRDGGNNMVTLATTPITYTSAGFPTITDLIDYSVTLPTVQLSDAWAGQQIGIQLVSTSPFPGPGYWDLDNVRLTAVPEPATWSLLAMGVAAGLTMHFRSRRQK